MAAPKKISLLPQEGFEFTTLGRIVGWSLSAGRAVVVITELVVITAFLSRFWLDRQLTDFNEKIQSQVALLKTYKSLEKEFTASQLKLEEISKFIQSAPIFGDDIQRVMQSVPQGIALTQVSEEKNAIQVSGLTSTEGIVEGFMGNLNSLKIGSITLSSLTIAPDEEGGVRFTILISKEKSE